MPFPQFPLGFYVCVPHSHVYKCTRSETHWFVTKYPVSCEQDRPHKSSPPTHNEPSLPSEEYIHDSGTIYEAKWWQIDTRCVINYQQRDANVNTLEKIYRDSEYTGQTQIQLLCVSPFLTTVNMFSSKNELVFFFYYLFNFIFPIRYYPDISINTNVGNTICNIWGVSGQVLYSWNLHSGHHLFSNLLQQNRWKTKWAWPSCCYLL